MARAINSDACSCRPWAWCTIPNKLRALGFLSSSRRISSYSVRARVLGRQGLRREVKPQHPAIHLVHVNQSPGDVDVAFACFVALVHARHRHPADPLALRLQLIL